MTVPHLTHRNLSPADASELRGRMYNGRKQAKGGDRKSKDQNDPLIELTAEAVAKETGVSAPTIKRDGKNADSAFLHRPVRGRGRPAKAEAENVAIGNNNDKRLCGTNSRAYIEQRLSRELLRPLIAHDVPRPPASPTHPRLQRPCRETALPSF